MYDEVSAFHFKATVNFVEDESDVYWIQLDFQEVIRWQVKRSWSEIRNFFLQFPIDFPDYGFCLQIPESSVAAEHIGDLLNKIITSLRGNLWLYEPILQLLDESVSQSSLTKARIYQLQAEIKSYQNKVAISDKRLSAVESIATAMMHALLELNRESAAWAPHFPSITAGLTLLQSSVSSLLDSQVTSPSNANLENISSISDSSSLQQPAYSESLVKRDPYSCPVASQQNQIVDQSNQSNPSQTSTTSQNSILNIPTEGYTSSIIPSLRALNLETVPEEWSVPFQETMDNFLIGVLPHENQIQYRMSALALLKREIRAVLGVVSFEIGLFAIRCFIADDPIKITLIVNPTQLAWWHTTLSEKLKILVENPLELHRLISEPGDLISEELRILMTHNLREVNCIHDKSQYKIVFGIDSVEGEITANNRNELCLLSFLEEVATLIGQNDLFKRSLIFIRCWWKWEAPNIVSADIASYLNEYAVSIMVTMIFNLYYQQITHPMVALLFFLREFSQFDVYNQAISLQGLVSFESESNNNQPKLIPPHPSHLITSEMIERYWKMFNLNDPLNIEPPSGLPKPQLDASTRQEMLKISMYRTLARFERRGFDIIHPFLNINLIPEKFSSRRLSFMQQAFTISFQSVTELLQQVFHGQANVREIPAKAFPLISSRANGQFRPDAMKNTVPIPGSDPNWSFSRVLSIENGLPKFLQNIYYCNFIADAILSESAIITFCIDLLLIRGPLPAGEVGKILSEASSVQNLSHRLREKYGGLKKFLERYPELFVFSNDHPFNPHILLRQTISPENLELIDRGIFPLHLLSKTARPAISYANLPRKPPSKPTETVLPVPAPSSFVPVTSSNPNLSVYNRLQVETGLPSNRYSPGNQTLQSLGARQGNYDYSTQATSTPSTYGGSMSTYEAGTNSSRYQPSAGSQSALTTTSSFPRHPVSVGVGGSSKPASNGYGDLDYRSYGTGGGTRSSTESSAYSSYFSSTQRSADPRSTLPASNSDYNRDYGYDNSSRGKFTSSSPYDPYGMPLQRASADYGMHLEDPYLASGTTSVSSAGNTISRRSESSSVGGGGLNPIGSRVVGGTTSGYFGGGRGYEDHLPAPGLPQPPKPASGLESSYSSYLNRDSTYSQF